MSHKEFVELYKSGKLNVYVNKSYSLRSISAGYLPKRYYWAHTFWSWIWLLSIPVGIIMLFFNVGIGILILFLVSFLGGKAVKRSAMDFVIQHALKDENFFDFAIKSKTIVIEKLNEKNKAKNDDLKNKEIPTDLSTLNGRDSIYPRVIEFTQKNEIVSIPLLQKKFKIGYARASRIMDHLEEDGLIKYQTQSNAETK